MESLCGKLLLATPKLGDPNFFQAVVLLLQHDEEGAFGVVLNRMLPTTIATMCRTVLDQSCALEGFLYQGGPCEGPLLVVHAHEEASQARVMEGLHFTTQRDQIELILGKMEAQARFFVGYSGWGPGQLEAELEIGSWLTVDTTAEVVLRDPGDLWEKLVTSVAFGRRVDPTMVPDDPSMN